MEDASSFKSIKAKKEIDLANEKIEEYWSGKGANYLKSHSIPEVRSVIYNRILYPIIDSDDHFFYVDSINVFIVLKEKCQLFKADMSYYYEVSASDDDIILEKSPIIPIGCPRYKPLYPTDMDRLAVKISV